MASTKILVPDMGDFKDVEIIEVLVKEGQQIKKNDSLITLEYSMLINDYDHLGAEVLLQPK